MIKEKIRIYVSASREGYEKFTDTRFFSDDMTRKKAVAIMDKIEDLIIKEMS